MHWPRRALRLWCGVPFEAVLGSLAEATGSPFRMEVHRPAHGPLLLADCYNANPASTEAALRTLGLVEAERKLALLGLMAELGAATESEHVRMASMAEELGIEVVGYQTDLYGEAHVDDVESAVALLKTLGPADAGTGQGEPGGPPRGRRRSASNQDRTRRAPRRPKGCGCARCSTPPFGESRLPP